MSHIQKHNFAKNKGKIISNLASDKQNKPSTDSMIERVNYEASKQQKMNKQQSTRYNISVNSQIKLSREYPSHSVLKDQEYNRINQLKYKYDVDRIVEENQQQSHIHQEQTFKTSFPKDQQSQLDKNVRKSKITMNSIRKNNIDSCFNQQKNEVQSIIFDSKVSHFAFSPEKKKEEIYFDSDFTKFKLKVEKVNSQIENGLSNLEKMLVQLKNKKSKTQIISFSMKKCLNLQEKIQQKDKKSIQFEERTSKINYSQEIQAIEEKRSARKAKQEDEFRNLPFQITPYQAYYDLTPLKIIKNEDQINELKPLQQRQKLVDFQNNMEDSKIQLVGKYKNTEEKFPQEYTIFINRLTNQITLDNQFTLMITKLTKEGAMTKIKKIILNEMNKYNRTHIKEVIQESFFELDASQIDPLNMKSSLIEVKYTQEGLEQEALKVYKKYKEIENHFRIKLENKFSREVVDILFDELNRFNFSIGDLGSHSSVTIGHLVSYLNMRTSKEFRNRSLIKLVKRMGLKCNSMLTFQAFHDFFLLM